MKGGSVVFLVFLLSVAHCASAASYLSFLNLGSPATLARGDDSYSNAIYTSSYSIRLGYSSETTVYVSINGYFSIGTTPSDSSLSKFSRSTSYSVVAPFAADIDTRSTGSVRYQTFTSGSSNINTVSSYIRSELGGSFSGRWMLVAEWNNVPQYSGFSFTTNTFQGVLITDGSTSYAVFLYNCPYMEWSGNAVIGWQASSSYYRNHPLSGTNDARQVACLNTATSSYNTVLFKLSSVSSCTSSSYFGCFDGTCEYSSSSRCDGYSDCSDGSDEVACSYYTCDSDEFQCDNGRCKPRSYRCDGTDDCGDNSDEEGCDNTCDSDEFQCDNGQCEPESYRCDNYDDCGDNSDEEGCVNVGLAVGLSVGLTVLLLFIGVPICVVCVGVCIAANRSRRPVARTQIVTTTPPAAGTTIVTTAQSTTSAAAPATQPVQQYYPAEFKTGPQEAPPPYPGSNYPAYPPPVPQPNTGYAPPPTGYPQAYPQPAQAPYGGQPYPYPQTPAYPPPTQDRPPTDAGNNAGFLLQQ